MPKSLTEKMEEAAGIRIPKPRMPYTGKEHIKSGEKARPWTGPRPWREKNNKAYTGDDNDTTAKEL